MILLWLAWLAAIAAVLAALNLVKHHYAQRADESDRECDEWCWLSCPHGRRP